MSAASAPSFSVVVCEGYHDRAFWKGLLVHHGLTDARPSAAKRVLDPWGDVVEGGRYAFDTPKGGFVVVAPARGGRADVRRLASEFLKNHPHKRLRHLVLSVDDDSRVCGGSAEASLLDWFAHVVRDHDGSAEIDGSTATLADGTTVHLAVWRADDPDAPGLPRSQTLERLVSAAIAEARPGEAESVAAFLSEAGHDAPAANAKSHAWSSMAHMWPEDGCERFFEHLWEDDRLASALEGRLGSAAGVAALLAATERG